MKTNWSEFQQNIFQFVENEKSNAVVSAVAGSGKTTTIVEAAKRIGKDKEVLFLAFNKTIATELSERLSDCRNVTCSTLHAHGLKALRSLRPFVDYKKGKRFQEQCLIQSSVLSIDDDKSLQYSFKSNCSKLYDLARIELIQCGDLDALENIVENHNIELIADEMSVVNDMLANAYDVVKSIDFTDMLTLPLQKSVKRFIPKYDVIFIDECQDLSKAQRELMLASLKPNGRFIAVGDRKQAINGFAGASCDSFDKLANISNTKELPLSVNYRCGSKIIGLAQNIVPQIIAHEGAEEGKVNHVTDMKGLQIGDMVLCRKSAPLVGLCLKMLANGIKANVKGKDLAEGLKNLVEKQKAKNISSLFDKLEKEQEKLKKALIKKGVDEDEVRENPKYMAFKDKVDCIAAIAERVTSIKALKETIEAIFSDLTEKNSVTLSTIHKSKGLESDNVWIVIPDKLPLVWKNQLEWQYEQEMNLKYVAITRAKKVLNFVDVKEENLKLIEF